MKYAVRVMIFLLASLMLTACTDENIELVKNSTFPQYPHTTIGKVFDASFRSTSWKYSESSKGTKTVTFTGKITKDLKETWIANVVMPALDFEYHRGRTPDAEHRAANIIMADLGNKQFAELSNKWKSSFYQEWNKLYKRKSDNLMAASDFDRAVEKLTEQAKNDMHKNVIDKIVETGWVVGDEVEFEWTISPNSGSVKLSRYAGNSLPRNLTNVLPVLYAE